MTAWQRSLLEKTKLKAPAVTKAGLAISIFLDTTRATGRGKYNRRTLGVVAGTMAAVAALCLSRTGLNFDTK